MNLRQVVQFIDNLFIIRLFCLIIFNFRLVYGADPCSEYWQEFTWTIWKNGSLQILTYGKIESEDGWKNVRSIQLSEQLSYQVSDNFSLGLNYKYVHGKNVVPNSLWRWHRHLEFEANPTFHSFCNSLIITRNRFEIIKTEKESKIRYRFRQRTMWVFPIKNWKYIKNFSAYNEIFYDLSRKHGLKQDWICPWMITLTDNNRFNLDVYFLIRYFLHEENTWKKSFVFGTQLNF